MKLPALTRTIRSTPSWAAAAGGTSRRTALGARCAKTLVAALVAAGPGFAGASTLTCYWVGQVYRASLGPGQYDPAIYTWGDALGWSSLSSGGGGSCLGGTPENGAFQYDVVIDNANAPALMADVGKVSLVQVVKDGQVISPTIAKLTLTNNSYLGLTGGTLTTGTLSADGSQIVGASVVVNGSQGSSSLNNMTIASTALTFSGPGSGAQITGNFALSRNRTTVGRTGGTVRYGVAPVLAVSSGATLNFLDATVYGQNATDASLGVINAGPGSVVGLWGTNSILGSTLQGEFQASSGSITTFKQTLNQGTLTALDKSAIYFNNGSMTQLAGAAAPGFSQTGAGSITITDLTASAGFFSGTIHMGGDGLGGGSFDNTLAGVTVKPGATLSFDSGSTSFSGSNQGTLSVQAAALQLTGSSSNDGGTLNNTAGGKVVIAGTFANQHGASITNSSSLVVANGATLNNDGSVTNLAHAAASNLGVINNSGVFDNQLGATLTNDGRLANQGSLVDAGIINGAGTLKQSAGSSQIDGQLKQASITIGGGALFGTGVVTATTTIEGGLVQGGSQGAAGTLTIDGGFVLGNGGTWQEFLSGAGPGQPSRLSISGDTSLAGTLSIVTGNGFAFAAGQKFEIASIHSGTLTGSFARIVDGSLSGSGNELAIGNGLELKVLYGSNDVLLDVMAVPVPEPSTWALMLCGAGVVGWLGGRRRANDRGDR
jgi:hypothetical protein